MPGNNHVDPVIATRYPPRPPLYFWESPFVILRDEFTLRYDRSIINFILNQIMKLFYAKTHAKTHAKKYIINLSLNIKKK